MFAWQELEGRGWGELEACKKLFCFSLYTNHSVKAPSRSNDLFKVTNMLEAEPGPWSQSPVRQTT